jgi:hypothetical protein
MDEGQRLKGEGIGAAQLGRSGLLDKARGIARELALKAPGRKISCDDVREAMGEEYRLLGPSSPAIFRHNPNWKHTGDYIESAHPESHRAIVRVWRYIGE